jgi:primosomal protein N'
LKGVSGKISISEPQDAYLARIRGRYRRQIVLKTTTDKWPEEIVKILKSLSSQWIVDVDPISII